jgi:pterin-4a-carbinolamine dehydratase
MRTRVLLGGAKDVAPGQPVKDSGPTKLERPVGSYLRENLHYTFGGFNWVQAFLDLVLQVGVAEEQGHHPDICFGWGRVEVTVWTHKINGLTESDFIFAAKVDTL